MYQSSKLPEFIYVESCLQELHNNASIHHEYSIIKGIKTNNQVINTYIYLLKCLDVPLTTFFIIKKILSKTKAFFKNSKLTLLNFINLNLKKTL